MHRDEELIERVRRGDVETYGQLVSRYRGLVFGVAYHHLGNAEDATDAAQDAFVRAYTKLNQVKDPARFGSWIRQIAANEARAKLAKRKDQEPLWCEHGVDPTPEVDNRVLAERMLQSLDEASRLTLILFYLHAYSYQEIGSFLDEPVTTIKSRLRNARAKLRRELEDVLDKDLNRVSPTEDFAERVTSLIEAARVGDAETIRSLLENDPAVISAREHPGEHTALHIAAASGNAPLVEMLLSYGADPNAIDESDNACPLHYACERGWMDCVKLLVEAGANVNWGETVHEATPLGWALIFEPMQIEVAEYLLGHGARMDLFSAIALGREDAVRDLAGKDPSVVNRRMSECEMRRSAIEFAASKKQFAIGRLLVELGAEVGLVEAAALCMMDRLEELLARKPDQALLDAAVKAAVTAGQVEATKVLLQSGANPDYAPQGTSLIFDAIGAGDRAMAEALLTGGADLEYRDRQWKSTALGWQVFFGNPGTTVLALELGSSIDSGLLDLARAGERGDLRRFSSGTPDGYRRVAELLERRTGQN